MGRDARSGKIGWLAYEPESRTIDESLVTDLQFDLRGSVLPVDHGYALYQAVAGVLPWLDDEVLGGIHFVHGAATGKGDMILGRRAKLVLRIASARIVDAMTLSGRTLDVCGHPLAVLGGKAKALSRHTPLFAQCVITGSEDEVDFANDVIRHLDELKIDSRFICGRRQSLRTPDGIASGYSLMLHGLPVEHSLLVQQQGLGKYRKMGCGIFVPHKSINALT